MALTQRQKEYQKFLRSPEWAKIRCDMLMIHDHSCQLCGRKTGLQVHHLNYNKPWGEEEPEDLILICNRCHRIEHGHKSKKKRRRKKKKKKHVKQVVARKPTKRLFKVRKNK